MTIGSRMSSVIILVESIPSQQSKAAGMPLKRNSLTSKSELLSAISRMRLMFCDRFGRMASFAKSFNGFSSFPVMFVISMGNVAKFIRGQHWNFRRLFEKIRSKIDFMYFSIKC